MKEFDDRKTFLDARKKGKQLGLDIFSVYDPVEAFQIRHGYTYFKGMLRKVYLNSDGGSRGNRA